MSLISNVSSQLLPIGKSAFTVSEKIANAAPEVNGAQSNIPKVYDRFIAGAESDEKFAKQIANDAAFVPDKLLVDLNDAPPLLSLIHI